MTDFVERRAVSNIQSMLDISARNMGFGQAMPDQMECLLSNVDVIIPDASLISVDRMRSNVAPYGPNGRRTLFGGPELVIESRSPSNWRAQEKRKRALYFANNVEVVWDVDEEQRKIWVYKASTPDTPIEFGMGDEIDCEPFLPGWRRKLEDIFADELLSAKTVVREVAEEWIEEGEAKALRRLLPRLIRTYFAAEPPNDLSDQLNQLDLAQLKTLENALETCNTLDEWLTLLQE